jgi:drug/metabolite transporter (DMT)-like permease
MNLALFLLGFAIGVQSWVGVFFVVIGIALILLEEHDPAWWLKLRGRRG